LKIITKLYSDNDIIVNEVNGYYEDNKLKFCEKDVSVIFDKDSKELVRENDEMLMHFSFDILNVTDSVVTLKEVNSSINLPIRTNNISISNNEIIIEYTLLTDNRNIKYEINMED